MTLESKIEELNKTVKGSLSITYFSNFCDGWELSSYGDNTLFSAGGELYKKNGGHLKDKSVKKLVEKAYRILKKLEKIKS